MPRQVRAGDERQPAQPACELAELVQYHCQLQHNRILCQPVERVFRKCARRPSVEVTHLVQYTPEGVPYLPSHLA